MKYSVIIPAYKCETALEATVCSIQKCGLTDFEIILVDDGSPDGTPALCDRLAAEQENVRCFHQPNAALHARMDAKYQQLAADLGWYGTGNYVGFAIDDSCLMTYTWYTYPKAEIMKPAQVHFDGEVYDTFGNFPQWLENAYGDYWNLPKNIMGGHSEFAELLPEDFHAMAAHGVLTNEEAESWIANGSKFGTEEFVF